MTRIVVDSGCDFTEDMKNGSIPNLDLIPLHLQAGEKDFIDDLDLDVSEYLDYMETCSAGAKTAAPSPELFLNSYKKEGDIFAVTVSSKISSTFNSAILAKQIYLEEIGEKFIHVIDSLSAGIAETLIVMKLNECIKKNLPNVEIIATINKFIEEMRTLFILEKFDNLIKSGRINPYVAKLASILSIKVICGDNKGEIVMVDKALGYKKSIMRLIDIIKKHNVDFENRILGITHVKCLERAMEYKNEILKKINFKDVVICEARGIIATYAHKGGLVFSF
ncbi:MAG: DegV family protein [Clostridiales bacterium]|nr:DegV family protein [Clostridiales bacterium]